MAFSLPTMDDFKKKAIARAAGSGQLSGGTGFAGKLKQTAINNLTGQQATIDKQGGQPSGGTGFSGMTSGFAGVPGEDAGNGQPSGGTGFSGITGAPEIEDASPSAADLQRQQIQAQKVKEEQSRIEAIRRQAAATGIDDSGIVAARERGAIQDVRQGAGTALTGINIEEQQAAERVSEAEKTREAVAENLAEQLGVQTRGQDIHEALAQEGYLVTREGQVIQKELGEAQIGSQEKIAALSNENRLALAQMEVEVFQSKILSDVQKAVIVAAMENIRINNPIDRAELNRLFDAMGVDVKLPTDSTFGNAIGEEITPPQATTTTGTIGGGITLQDGTIIPESKINSPFFNYEVRGDVLYKDGTPVGKIK